jgi:hypothetical protein
MSDDAGLLPRPVAAEPSPFRAELDRLGASFRKAGTANYVSATFRSDGVKLNGPPRDRPRRSWLGPEWQALELLAALPADAGAEAVWRALSGSSRRDSDARN